MVSGLYAAILAVLYLGLTYFIIHGRVKYRVGLGDGGLPDLARRIRIHGNFAEFVPFALLLMALAEMGETPDAALHIMGMILITGRVLHAYGLYGSDGESPGRKFGTIFTHLVMIGAAVSCLFTYFS